MAKVIVAIEMPKNLNELAKITSDKDNDNFENGKILLDEALLDRSEEDDSFFAFEFIGITE